VKTGRQLTAQELLNCKKLCDSFEGREAIYTGKGNSVLIVRVTNIRRIRSREIHALVEEVPTRGFELCRRRFAARPDEPTPARWKIAAGFLTTFSDHIWTMGYGGWSLYFAPELVNRLRQCAAEWPAEATVEERYELAFALRMDWMMGPDKDGPTTSVFSRMTGYPALLGY
jgi:hypothetical protein